MAIACDMATKPTSSMSVTKRNIRTTLSIFTGATERERNVSRRASAIVYIAEHPPRGYHRACDLWNQLMSRSNMNQENEELKEYI